MTEDEKKIYVLGCIINFVGLKECSTYLNNNPRANKMAMAEWIFPKLWHQCLECKGISYVETWSATEELIKQIRGEKP